MHYKYSIPLSYKKGEYGPNDLKNIVGETFEFDFDSDYGIIEYTVPNSRNDPRLYDIPADVLESTLKAFYDDNGQLKKVTVNNEDNKDMLVFIRYDGEEAAKEEIRSFALENAKVITEQLIKSRDKAARLFVEYYYDGSSMDYHALIGTEEQKRKLEEKYPGDDNVVDNSGDYNIYTNLVCGDNETLGIMIICANTDSSKTDFVDYAIEIMTEYIRENVVDKLDKTDDFKFVADWYD